MKVKLVKFLEGMTTLDLTIGNVYETLGRGTVDHALLIIDDVGHENEIYDGEYEVVEE